MAVPVNSGFCRGHAAGWAGSAVPGRSAAARPAGGVTPAGAADGWFVYEGTVPRSCAGLASYRLETSTRASVPLPAARPPFPVERVSLC